MYRAPSARVILVLALVLTAACEAAKSANPLSPAVAGPIAGVDISAPRLIEPSQGVDVREGDQPVKLVVENATTSGQRKLFYLFEVASDSEFKTKVFARDGVPAGDGGRTVLTLPDRLASNRKYYWRCRAADGANSGPFANATTFDIVPPAVIKAPLPVEPINDARTASVAPVLIVKNADRSGPVGGVSYLFEVARDQGFTEIVSRQNAGEAGGQSGVGVGLNLDADRRFFWHARASDGQTTSSWSPTATFFTPAAAPSSPPPSIPPPGSGGNANCAPPYPNNGPAVVDCIERKYPQYRVAGVSVAQRKANMAFLRDRVIEAGICGGMRLGWNMKRGGPEKSIDFIAWHDGRQWIGVDIGRAYDDTRKTLDLVWGIYKPTPDAREYSPQPSCH